MSVQLRSAIIVALSISRLTEGFPQSLVTTEVDTTFTPPSSGGEVRPLEITKFHVNSTIKFRYARTQVVSHVKNPGTAPNKADFTIVLPDSAFISNFSMIINGVEYIADVLEKEEAKKTYDEAVTEGRGAGIISKEARDSSLFTVSTNIEPGQKVVFKLTYEELLERKAGVYEHVINIDPNQIVDDLRIDVFINESLPISSISVPELVESNELDFTNNEESKIAVVTRNVDGYENNARIVFAPTRSYQEEAGAQGISGQLHVKYDLDRKGQANEVQVIDGYFVHYFVPDDLETLPKHAIFVLDVSGSMYGEKMDQLKDAMFTVLDDMTDTDYFNIIAFSDGVTHWEPLEGNKEESGNSIKGAQKAVPATDKNKNNAIKHVIGLEADGGTNINEAMLEGIKLAENALKNEDLPNEVKSMIIFLTDGLPSVGESDGNVIKKNIKDANDELAVPIFCIGFGRDADFDLMKDISQEAESFSKRIYEGSDAALQLEHFYSEIASPLISNLKFSYVGGLVENSSISNRNLKTFFKGGEYVITGKLEDKAAENETFSIQVIGDDKMGSYAEIIQICLNEEQEKENLTILYSDILPSSCYFPPSYPPRSMTQDFMQKLHAFINIKQLVKNSDPDSKERALKLALQNNFVTDLTSLVVVRPDEAPTVSSLENVDQAEVQDRFSSHFIVGGGNAGVQNIQAVVADYDDYEYEVYTLEEESNSTSIPQSPLTTTIAPECTGNLTLFSKTYLRGVNLTVTDKALDFSDLSFDNLSVSASVSGNCCWTIFTEKDFSGKTRVLSSNQKYTSVASLGELFRDVSSARKQDCQ